MAQKFNKYGANHKNDFQKKVSKWADKLRHNVREQNQMLGSEINTPSSQELIDAGWSFIHLNINNASIGKWVATDKLKEKVDELKAVPETMVDGLLSGMMSNNKIHDLLTDNNFLFLSFATHDTDVKQSLYDFFINTKTGQHQLTRLELTAERMDNVEKIYKENGAVEL